MKSPKVTFNCSHCGEPVQAGSKVCRACGASDDCGWNDDDLYDHGLDDDDDDYADSVYGEAPDYLHPDHAATQAGRIRLWARLIILAIIVSLLLTMQLF